MRCHRCGEQWDLDTVHDEAAYVYADDLAALRRKCYGTDDRDAIYGRKGHTSSVWTREAADRFQKEYEQRFFNPTLARFRAEGCVALGGDRCASTLDRGTSEVLSTIYELLGDDVDGAEAMIEDAEYLGLL